MKNLILLFVSAATVLACSKPQEISYTWSDISFSGEFLFDGPNTLQGSLASPLNDIAAQLNIDASSLVKVYVNGAQIIFDQDTLRGAAESALVQIVSNQLDLLSIGTKSPLQGEEVIRLDVKTDLDILPYLRDVTSSIVVDVNLNQELDELSGKLALDLKVLYKNN